MNDGPDDGDEIDEGDAEWWATQNDYDGDGIADPLPEGVLVLADVGERDDCDGSLFHRFRPECDESDIFCQYDCWVDDQFQIVDQGGVTVDDPCGPWTGSGCGDCRYDDAHVRSVLDSILPAEWCGEGTP